MVPFRWGSAAEKASRPTSEKKDANNVSSTMSRSEAPTGIGLCLEGRRAGDKIIVGALCKS